MTPLDAARLSLLALLLSGCTYVTFEGDIHVHDIELPIPLDAPVPSS